MKPLILLGEEGKRTDYFLKAAQMQGVRPVFFPLDTFAPEAVPPAVIKIDPYHYDSWEIDRMQDFLTLYQKKLQALSQSHHLFLNDPSAILTALDKRQCKNLLLKQNIPVTEMLQEVITTPSKLRETITARHFPGVFIKPRYGSAATGILAYRFAPLSGRQILYTSSQLKQGRLLNTKRIHRLEDPVGIENLLQKVLSEEPVIERWHPKDKINGRAYDLRAVVQFGRLDYLIARTSRGPITNLQLNNGAMAIEALRLSHDILDQIEAICLKTLNAIPGLHYAGIDLLLEENTRKPYVIEVNGQGDLLYQDIFQENRIYSHQIAFYLQHLC